MPARLKWPLRMAAILVAVALVDGMAVWLSPHPLWWARLVPLAVLPLTVIFVLLPMIRGGRP